MASTTTQLAVIGAGPGGYAAAFLAADLGMQVTLIDSEPNPGGVCLYRGCIPSKALLHIAKVITEAKESEAFGVQFGKAKIDPKKIQAWKNDIVANQVGGLGQLSKARKINYLQGRAKFNDASNLVVELTDGGTTRVSFGNAVIATGSRPATVPALSIDSDNVLDSTGALDLDDIPKSMLVVGGGYIGLELGSVYATLGSRVSVVEMMPSLLPGADGDLVRFLHKQVEPLFDRIMLKSTVKSLKEQKNGIRVTIESEGEESDSIFEKVLISVGRRPNSEDLGLDNTRADIDEKGFINVDEQCRTREPSIFAIGDVVGEPMLAHKASHEGRTAVEVIAGHNVAFEPAAIPAVVFTDPEIAWCGLTETQAKQSGQKVTVARFPWAASGRARTIGRGDGMTKLLIDPESERILGAGIVGPGAGELIAECVHAIEMASLASDLKLSIHPHPTLSETVMEAAEVFFGQATHVYRPKRS